MPKGNPKPHITRGDVLDDLGFAPRKALELKIKSDLHLGILKLIKKHGYTPRQLESILNVQQSRVSELMTGKIVVLSLGRLAEYADKLGAYVNVNLTVKDKVA